MAKIKRKKIVQEGSSPKKQKTTAIDVKAVNPKSSDVVTILDRLLAADKLEALADIVRDEDGSLVQEFLSMGGQADDLLRTLQSDEKVKSPEAATVFNAVETVLLAIAREGSGKYSQVALDITRKILQEHMRYVMMLVSPTNTVVQAKSCLRMLTAMVTCGTATAKEVLLKIDFEHKYFEDIHKRTSKEKPDVRTCFIHFMLSFFVLGSPNVIKEFLLKKTKLALIFQGLRMDEADTVVLVLSTLKQKMIENTSVSKTSKMKLFSVVNLKPLLGLYDWKGPKKEEGEDSTNEVFVHDLATVREATHEFLKILLCSSKFGVVFNDSTVGTTGKSQNHLLQNLLQGLKTPWENPHLAELLTGCLQTCPDLVRPYLQSLQGLWSPRPSPSWIRVIDLIISIFEAQQVEQIVQTADKKILVNALVGIFCPEKLVKDLLNPAIEYDSLLVSRRGIELLHLITKKLKEAFADLNAFSKKLLVSRIKDRFPKLKSLTTFWKNEVTNLQSTEGTNDVRNLVFTLNILDFYMSYLGEDYLLIDLPEMLKNVSDLEHIDSDQARFLQITLMKYLSAHNIDELTDVSMIKILISISLVDHGQRQTAVSILKRILLKAGISEDENLYFVDICLHHLNEDCLEFFADAIANAVRGSDKCLDQAMEWNKQFKFGDEEGGNDDDEFFEALLDPNYSSGKVSSSNTEPVRREMLQSSFSLAAMLLSQDDMKEQERTFVGHCLSSFPYFLEDPALFAAFLNSLDLPVVKKVAKSFLIPGKELNNVGKHHETFLMSLVEAMKIVTAIKMLPASIEANSRTLISFLEAIEDQEEQLKIATEVLERPSIRERFLPLSEKFPTTTEAIYKCLSHAHPSTQTDYKELFLNQLSNAIESKDYPKHMGGFSTAFAVFVFSATELVHLMKQFLQVPASDLSKNDVLRAMHIKCLDHLAEPQKTLVRIDLEALTKLTAQIEHLILDLDGLEYLEVLHRLLKAFPRMNDLLSDTFALTLAENVLKMKEESVAAALNVLCIILERSPKRATEFRKWVSKHPALETSSRLLPGIMASCSGSHAKAVTPKVTKRILAVFEKDVQAIPETEDNDDLCRLVTHFCREFKVDVAKKCHFEVPENLQTSNVNKLAAYAAMCSSQEAKNDRFLKMTIIGGVKLCMEHLQSVAKSQKNEENFQALPEVMTNIGSLPAENIRAVMKEDKETWTRFVRCILKYSMKIDDHFEVTSTYVDALAAMCKSVYGEKNEEDKVELKLLYDMILGHSNFFGLVLESHPSGKESLKQSILHLILSILRLDPKVCDTKHIPIFLSVYRSKMTASDQTVLKIIYLLETNGFSLSDYKPILWGPAAVSHYSVNKGAVTSLWKVPKTSEVLALIDSETMIRSAMELPLNLKLSIDPNEDEPAFPSELYDPRFYLPLLSQLCSPGSFIDRHLRLIESGAFAFTMASLSSKDEVMRSAGYTVLSRMHDQIEGAKLSAEKQVWIHLINIVRNGAVSDKGCLRIPSLVTGFLVRISMILRNPLDPMYKAVSSFILAKPSLDLFNIPEFLRLFHSREVQGHNEAERQWILGIIRDGMKDPLDYKISQKAYLSKMLCTFYESVLSDPTTRTIIMDILLRVVSMTQPCFDMIRYHGLLLWLLGLRHDLGKVVAIVNTAWATVSTSTDDLPATMLREFSLVVQGLLSHKVSNHSLTKPLLETLGCIVRKCKEQSVECAVTKDAIEAHCNKNESAEIQYLLDDISNALLQGCT